MGMKEDVCDWLSFVDVVGEYVCFIFVGKGWFKGLCFFYKEKIFLFQVDIEKGYYYCFGCKVSGDVFGFVQQMEYLSFGDVLCKFVDCVGI